MERQLLAGERVALSSFTGKLERIVVRDVGNVVYVCRPEEYERANQEAREPIVVGFKKDAVLS